MRGLQLFTRSSRVASPSGELIWMKMLSRTGWCLRISFAAATTLSSRGNAAVMSLFTVSLFAPHQKATPTPASRARSQDVSPFSHLNGHGPLCFPLLASFDGMRGSCLGNQASECLCVAPEIHPWPEVGDSLLRRTIHSLHRDFQDGNLRPDGSNQDLHFKLKSPRCGPEAQGLWQGIQPEPALGIGNPFPAGGPDPEIRESYGPSGWSRAHWRCSMPDRFPSTRGRFPFRAHLHKRGDIVRMMLAVGVEGDGVVRRFERSGEAVEKGRSFALVHPVTDDGNVREGSEELGC